MSHNDVNSFTKKNTEDRYTYEEDRYMALNLTELQAMGQSTQA